jgi:hypothetical protein
MLQFIFSVQNLNIATNLENYYFYGMLIACKCMPFCKKQDYDAKNEPPTLQPPLKMIGQYGVQTYFTLKF